MLLRTGLMYEQVNSHFWICLPPVRHIFCYRNLDNFCPNPNITANNVYMVNNCSNLFLRCVT